MSEDNSKYLSLPTADGGHVLLYVDAVCASFGIYGIRVDATGSLEGLVIGPDSAEWRELGELPVVSAGMAKPAKVRRS